MSALTVNTQIERFITEKLLRGSRQSVGPDESLISSGILDSLNWLQLVGFVEKRFGVKIEDSELTPEAWDTVNAIGELVVRKQANRKA